MDELGGTPILGKLHLYDLRRLLDDVVGIDDIPCVCELLPMMLGIFLQGSVSCCFLPTLTYCQVRDPVTCPEDWVSCGHCLLLFYCLFYLLRA
jgi:hypothetical protein